ncbi:MAG: tyrosine-type recombinase/integrase [bacterium]|nr:tyrosine-type recombinase/integrase [bacterium]
MSIDKALREFLEDLELEKGRSQKTIQNYEHYLARFFREAKIKKPSDITDARVREFRLKLNRTGLGAKTRNYHLIALRMFLKYLVKREILSLAPDRIELAKLPDRDIDIPPSEDLDRLLKAPDTNTLQGLRDRAILEMLFSTGLRVSELTSLDCDTIDFSRDEFSIRGKGSKVRIVFLSPDAKQACQAYTKKREDVGEALFVGTQKKNQSRLTTRQVERLVARYAVKSGIPGKVTPHTLRHMFATDLLMNGADIRSVQVLLGHSSITTTQIYTHMTDRQLRDVHKAFHGKRRRKTS